MLYIVIMLYNKLCCTSNYVVHSNYVVQVIMLYIHNYVVHSNYVVQHNYVVHSNYVVQQ